MDVFLHRRRPSLQEQGKASRGRTVPRARQPHQRRQSRSSSRGSVPPPPYRRSIRAVRSQAFLGARIDIKRPDKASQVKRSYATRHARTASPCPDDGSSSSARPFHTSVRDLESAVMTIAAMSFPHEAQRHTIDRAGPRTAGVAHLEKQQMITTIPYHPRFRFQELLLSTKGQVWSRRPVRRRSCTPAGGHLPVQGATPTRPCRSSGRTSSGSTPPSFTPWRPSRRSTPRTSKSSGHRLPHRQRSTARARPRSLHRGRLFQKATASLLWSRKLSTTPVKNSLIMMTQ